MRACTLLELMALNILRERERMAIEIKGLGEAVKAARKGIADVRTESAGLGDDTRALLSTLKDVRAQVNAAHEDLKFEASTLGNSPPAGEEPAKPLPKPLPEFADGGEPAPNPVHDGTAP